MKEKKAALQHFRTKKKEAERRDAGRKKSQRLDKRKESQRRPEVHPRAGDATVRD